MKSPRSHVILSPIIRFTSFQASLGLTPQDVDLGEKG